MQEHRLWGGKKATASSSKYTDVEQADKRSGDSVEGGRLGLRSWNRAFYSIYSIVIIVIYDIQNVIKNITIILSYGILNRTNHVHVCVRFIQPLSSQDILKPTNFHLFSKLISAMSIIPFVLLIHYLL